MRPARWAPAPIRAPHRLRSGALASTHLPSGDSDSGWPSPNRTAGDPSVALVYTPLSNSLEREQRTVLPSADRPSTPRYRAIRPHVLVSHPRHVIPPRFSPFVTSTRPSREMSSSFNGAGTRSTIRSLPESDTARIVGGPSDRAPLNHTSHLRAARRFRAQPTLSPAWFSCENGPQRPALRHCPLTARTTRRTQPCRPSEKHASTR